MFSRLSTVATVAVVVASASASSLSSSCQSALTSVAQNEDASACLSPSSLVSLAIGDGSASIIDPINSWLGSLCSAPACSNETLSAVATNVTNGCASELSILGYSSGDDISSVVAQIQQGYPTVRQILCLKDSGTNCITQTLTNAEGVYGTLSVNNIVKLAASGDVAAPPSNITCTNCIKQAYNVLNTDYPSLIDEDDKTSITSQCGATFLDGSSPSGISESASSSSATKDSGAVSILSSSALAGLGLSALTVVTTAFAFLA